MVYFEWQLSNFLSPFINVESSGNSIAEFNMKPSRGESMGLTEIKDKPIGTDEIPKLVTFLSKLLRCHLTKCGTIEESFRCNEITHKSPGQFNFFLFGEYSMKASMRILKLSSPARVLRPRGFPVVKSRPWEFGNLTHSRVSNREYIGKDRLKGSSMPVGVMMGSSGE
jgi:hypothetical protein